MKVNQELVERVIHHQADTDATVADLEYAYRQSEAKAEEILATMFLHSEGTVAERQAIAKASREYQTAKAEELAAFRDWRKLRNKRETGNNIIEVWRSIEASRRAGNV